MEVTTQLSPSDGYPETKAHDFAELIDDALDHSINYRGIAALVMMSTIWVFGCGTFTVDVCSFPYSAGWRTSRRSITHVSDRQMTIANAARHLRHPYVNAKVVLGPTPSRR